MKTAYQETRVALVVRIAREARLARELVVQEFADDFVAQAYVLVPDAFAASNLRIPHPTDASQHDKDRTHNRQIVERWIKGEVRRFAAEFEEPWVLALPEPYRGMALAQLSERYGLLPAKLRHDESVHAGAGELSAAMGMVFKRFAPIAEDGVINHLDRPHLKPFLEALAQAQGVLASLHAQAAAALRDEPTGAA